jgi:hypothetical protein
MSLHGQMRTERQKMPAGELYNFAAGNPCRVIKDATQAPSA